MKIPFKIKAALICYDIVWLLAIPLLLFSSRLRDGFLQRILLTTTDRLPTADIWIQAASVGESFLALEILKKLTTETPTSVLVTTNTRQGLNILNETTELTSISNNLTVHTRFFPLDMPAIMRKAVKHIAPKALVLLETELWPGLLAACKENQVRVALVNGRINQKSLDGYNVWKALWRFLRPDITLAISHDDADRFAQLFGKDTVKCMSNIKFDRLLHKKPIPRKKNKVGHLISENSEFVVFGSVREEEEEVLEKAIKSLFDKKPDIILGLFPRHLHRIPHWQKIASTAKINWQLRSKTKNKVPNGTVIIWDTFGELGMAYEIANTVFIGGSLAPLGGQNFLEPLICGIIPILGPSWFNFAWVGKDIVSSGLLIEVKNWHELSEKITEQLANKPDRQSIQQKINTFIETRKGGTLYACETILQLLTNN